jgi:hypothetical protein
MHIDLLSALAYRHGPEAAHRIPWHHVPCHEPDLASQPILSTDEIAAPSYRASAEGSNRSLAKLLAMPWTHRAPPALKGPQFGLDTGCAQD